MSLKAILVDLASEGAIKITNNDQLALVTHNINEAAQEIYTNNDLIGSLLAQIFGVEVDSGNQISMPTFVGNLRAVRYYLPQVDLGLFDMRARFQPVMWQSKDWLGWTLRKEYALKRDITNASILTLTFRQALTVACEITISGETPYASGNSEVISCPIGTTSVQSTGSYSEINNLSFNVPRNVDCDVTDIDDVLMATIVNKQLESSYQIIQLTNLPNITQTLNIAPYNNFVDVLFKRRFVPFVNLNDEFQCRGYDKAIYWKYKEHRAAITKGEEKLSIGYHEKCKEIITGLEKDYLKDVVNKMIFVKEGVYAVYDRYLKTEAISPDAANINYFDNCVTQ